MPERTKVAPAGTVQLVEAVAHLQLAHDAFGRKRLAHHLPVLGLHSRVDVGAHHVGKRRTRPEDVLQLLVLAGRDAQHLASIRVHVEGAHDQVVAAQGLDQVAHPALAPFLVGLLVGNVQQEALVELLAVLLDDLDVAHHVPNLAVLVAHAVLGGEAVPHLGELHDLLAQAAAVLPDHGRRHHVEALLAQFLLGREAEDVERRPVDAQDARAVKAMRQDAAVERGEDGLQRVVLLDQVVLVGAFLRDVDADAHRSHDGAVEVVQGRFVGGEQPGAGARLDDLLGHAGLPGGHDLALGLDAGGVVLLHVPDVCMALPLHLLLRLVDGVAEAGVHLLVHAVAGLVPHEAGDGVYRCVEELPRLPQIGGKLALLLPALEAERGLGRIEGSRPKIGERRCSVSQLRQRTVRRDEHEPGALAHVRHDVGHQLRGVVDVGSKENGVGAGNLRRIRHVVLDDRVLKPRQRMHCLQGKQLLVGKADDIYVDRAVVHSCIPFCVNHVIVFYNSAGANRSIRRNKRTCMAARGEGASKCNADVLFRRTRKKGRAHGSPLAVPLEAL